MMERYLFVKLVSEQSTEEGRRFCASEARALAGAEGLQSLTVGLPADAAALAAWDMSLVLRFASLEAADLFFEGPAYRAYTEGFLGACGRVIKAWTFDVAPD